MKTIEEIVKEIFHQVFGDEISDSELQSLSFGNSPKWDSLAQMNLLTIIEETFAFFIPFEEMTIIKDMDSAVSYIKDKIS